MQRRLKEWQESVEMEDLEMKWCQEARVLSQICRLCFHLTCCFFNKESFLSFVSDVLVGANKAANRSDTIRLVLEAAERYFNIKQLPDKLHHYMMESLHKERSQLLRASSMEDVDGEEDLYPH